MQSQPSTGLARAWMFRIVLLACAVACFVITLSNVHDRRDLANGIPATIELASLHETLPSSWTPYEGMRVQSSTSK